MKKFGTLLQPLQHFPCFFRNRILTILTFEGSKQTILSFLRIAHFYDGYLYCRSEQQEGVSHTN